MNKFYVWGGECAACMVYTKVFVSETIVFYLK